MPIVTPACMYLSRIFLLLVLACLLLPVLTVLGAWLQGTRVVKGHAAGAQA